jgi:hypothetical protein
MRHALVVVAAVLLYRARPDLFAWDAAGFRTLLAFTAVIVVLTLAPRRG